MELYNYKAKVVRVIDGDTVDVDVDLGFGITRRERLRLADIDAPEIRTKDAEMKQAAIAATDFVKQWVDAVDGVVVTTVKDNDKYGRYLARVYAPQGECLNDLLVEKGLAVVYED